METKFFKDKQGRDIRLESSNPSDYIEAYCGDVHIGKFDFTEVDNGYECALKVTHMFLDKTDGYLGCGIGTEIVDWAEEFTGLNVVFGRDDGITSEDGSHLTGGGPGFAEHIYQRRKVNN